MTVEKDQIELPARVVITLALESWRLGRIAEQMEHQPNGVSVRYSARKMRQSLEAAGCSFIDLTGKRYDAGMAVEIIDTEGSEGNESRDNSELFIKEMIAPIILLHDRLLASGQVILERRVIESIE